MQLVHVFVTLKLLCVNFTRHYRQVIGVCVAENVTIMKFAVSHARCARTWLAEIASAKHTSFATFIITLALSNFQYSY